MSASSWWPRLGVSVSLLLSPAPEKSLRLNSAAFWEAGALELLRGPCSLCSMCALPILQLGLSSAFGGPWAGTCCSPGSCPEPPEAAGGAGAPPDAALELWLSRALGLSEVSPALHGTGLSFV